MLPKQYQKSEIKVIGIRPGEKKHEELITISDGVNTIDRGNYYVITPSFKNIVINASLGV